MASECNLRLFVHGFDNMPKAGHTKAGALYCDYVGVKIFDNQILMITFCICLKLLDISY